MRQGGFLITRGLTGTHTNMIIRGMIPLIEEVIDNLANQGKVRIIDRKSRKKYEDIKKNEIDEYIITVELLGINGKDLFEPIINKVTKTFVEDNNIIIEAEPTQLVIKQPNIEINVKIIDIKMIK